jgi:hypothetical protein
VGGSSMKHLASIPLLWILVLLCGCGGGGRTSAPPADTPSPNPPVPGPPAQTVNVAGNWQFNTTSKAGMPPLAIGGNINQSGNSVSGAVHVSGSNCFDQLTTVGITGTLAGRDISLTSASVGGQVITFTGTVTNNAFTGTYTIEGGCTSADQGSVTAIQIFAIGNTLSGTFTASGGETFTVTADVAQASSASPEGSFPITGTGTLTTPCFNSGTLMSGTFPSGSYILGTSVALEIQTSNGIVRFLGTWNVDKAQISGNYTITGGTCDQTGTGILNVSSPWDY